MYYIIQSCIQTEDRNVMRTPNSGWWLPLGVGGKCDWESFHRGFKSFCNIIFLRLVGENGHIHYIILYALCIFLGLKIIIIFNDNYCLYNKYC